MTKIEKARTNLDLIEAAIRAAEEAMWPKLRYEYEYFNIAEGEEPDWYNDEWLQDHVNAKGCEYLQVVDEFIKSLESKI